MKSKRRQGRVSCLVCCTANAILILHDYSSFSFCQEEKDAYVGEIFGLMALLRSQCGRKSLSVSLYIF